MNTRTNIVLNDELINAAMQKAGVTTKKDAVDAALRAFVRKPNYSGWLALRGAGLIDDAYEHDALPQTARIVSEPTASPMGGAALNITGQTKRQPSRRRG